MLLLESHFILVDKLYGKAMLIFEQDNESLERDFYLLASCLQTEQSSYPYILTTSCHLSSLGEKEKSLFPLFIPVVQIIVINNQNCREYFQGTSLYISSHNAMDARIHMEADFSLHFFMHIH